VRANGVPPVKYLLQTGIPGCGILVGTQKRIEVKDVVRTRIKIHIKIIVFRGSWRGFWLRFVLLALVGKV